MKSYGLLPRTNATSQTDFPKALIPCRSPGMIQQRKRRESIPLHKCLNLRYSSLHCVTGYLVSGRYLISSTYRGTFASIGPNLSALRHDCTRTVYPSINESLMPVGPPAGGRCPGALQAGVCERYDPSTYANYQWLQSIRVFPNGTGFAMVHNEVSRFDCESPWAAKPLNLFLLVKSTFIAGTR